MNEEILEVNTRAVKLLQNLSIWQRFEGTHYLSSYALVAHDEICEIEDVYDSIRQRRRAENERRLKLRLPQLTLPRDIYHMMYRSIPSMIKKIREYLVASHLRTTAKAVLVLMTDPLLFLAALTLAESRSS